MTSDDFRDRGEEAYRLPVSLVDWHNEDTVGEMDTSLTSSADRTGPLTILRQYSRGRVLELALLLSIIVSVICSALWLSGIFTPGMSLHRTDTSPLTTKKGIQVVATQTTNAPTGQPSVQASNVVTVLPSAQSTPVLATQLAVPGKSTPTAQSPSPTPTMPTSYEAEASQNTRGGDATIDTCSGCSGGKRVGNVGQSGTLQFNNVSKASPDNYTLTIYYTDGDAGRSLSISVNGGGGVSVSFHGTNDGNWVTPQSISITVSLNAGNNTIKFYNPSARGPDIDRIVV